jgi:spermidine synthase
MSYRPEEREIGEAATTSPESQYYHLLLMLFVASGCSALIYEIVWFQMLQLVIGLSALSLGVLLGTYMGGMFLGSILLTRLIPTKVHPLRVYALLELGIGVTGILLLFAMPWIDQVYINSVGHGLAGILLRCAVCAAGLLPPTLLMGATLPAMARWVERTPWGVSWLGFFYSGNIAGAVCGCLLAGYYLLRVFDIAVATYLAAAINFGVAAIGIWLALKTPYRGGGPAPVEKETSVRAPGFQLVYLAIALSGLTALGAEVVWTRLLSLILGGTVYTFAIILAVFLTGLGIGSSGGAFLVRRTGRPRAMLGLCQLLLTGAMAWAAFAITKTFLLVPADPAGLPSTLWASFQIDLLRSLLAILPAAILWGASFPLALASVASPGREPGRLVGEVYASNTFGSIVGAIGFSLFAVPRMGTQQAQQLMVGLAGVAALALLVSRREPGTPPVAGKSYRGLRLGLACATFGITLLLAWSIPATPWGMAAYGRKIPLWTDRLAPGITAEKDIPTAKGKRDLFCTFFREGMSESVAVTMRKDGVRSFHASGKAQASSDPADMRLQRMLGHLSALTVDNPRSVLVVACGAGVTAGTYVLYPSVKRIVICELEKLVPQFVAPQFKRENYGVVSDPRTEVIIDDGRHFVRSSQEKFDIITTDPVDPWMKGSAALYTEEYFTSCRKHLNPGGVMTLWVPFYGNSTEAVKSLIAAFFKAFPEGIIWSNEKSGEGYDAVLFGQAGPVQINVDKVQQLLNDPAYLPVTRSLGEVGFHSAIELFSTFAGYGPLMQTWLADAQVNIDTNLRLQYLAGQSLDYAMQGRILDEIMLSYSFPEKIFNGSPQSILALKKMAARSH